MTGKAYLIFPLTSAVLYAGSAILLNAAQRRGVSTGRITVLANVVLSAAFAFFYPWSDFPALPSIWWPVLAMAGAFVIGQVFTILAFTAGEVSVATPVLATKVIMVAAIVSLWTGRSLSLMTWLGGVAMVAGIWLLVSVSGNADRRRAVIATVASLIGAFGFACLDILVEQWSSKIGWGILTPMSIAIGTVFTIPLLALRSKSKPSDERASAKGLLLWGILLGTLQSLVLVWSIGKYHDATGANIVYASRGLWSIMIVALLPQSLRAVEHFSSPSILIRRAIGAVIMMAGVLLAFASP